MGKNKKRCKRQCQGARRIKTFRWQVMYRRVSKFRLKGEEMNKALETAKANLLQAIGKFNVLEKQTDKLFEKAEAFDNMLAAIDALIAVAKQEKI